MSTLTKLALGLIETVRPLPASGPSAPHLQLPDPSRHGGLPLMDALWQRSSRRAFDPAPLPEQTLADLLWSAAGINRPKLGGRTTPSALNAQEVQVYVALPNGLFRYRPRPHDLQRVMATDVRRVTGYQDFVDNAPLDLIYVADHTQMRLVPVAQREAFAFAAAGAMAQSVYLYCASAGLATVLRAWFDHPALARAMHLGANQQLLLAQTVGLPAPEAD